MPSASEQSIVLRRFDGTNILLDQAYLGPSYLRASQNWIPGDTFRLTKMPGTIAFPGGFIPGVTRIQAIRRAYDPLTADRYLYAVATPTDGTGDQVWVSVDDGVFNQVQLTAGGPAVFTAVGGTYSIDVLNFVVYIGNGQEPILSIPLNGTGTFLLPVKAFVNGEGDPTLGNDQGAQILSGSYSYTWCIFDHTVNVWVERGSTRQVTKTLANDQSISFPAPTGFASNSGVLCGRFRAHLFVAPINLPIEFAHDQTPQGIGTGAPEATSVPPAPAIQTGSAIAATVLRALVADGPPLPLQGLARTGNIVRGHRGRLWIAGDTLTPSATNATWVSYLLVPGLEQGIFNTGLFWPVNGRLPRTPDTITGLGICATGEDQDQDSPIAIFTLSRTYLFYGDALDDPSAEFVQVSRRIGCTSKNTVVETPYGLFWLGLYSVYYMPLGGGLPQEIGWPIRPAIQAIPPGQTLQCSAIFHKGFYKLAIVPPGTTKATVQWWLDLRRGITSVPSWWGPHIKPPVAAWCVADQDPAESDRAFVALDLGDGSVEIIHQPLSATEQGGLFPLISLLQTGDLDDGRPFQRKIFTRVRATTFPQKDTTISVAVSVDGGTAATADPMTVRAPAGGTWNVDSWNVAQWAQSTRAEGESVLGPERPYGETASIQLTHADKVPISLRDFELRYLPVVRPTRSVTDDTSGPFPGTGEGGVEPGSS